MKFVISWKYCCIFNPGVDFAYGLGDDSQVDCLSIDFIPLLKLSAGLKLYKSLGVAVEFPITTTITLEYPTDACGRRECNTDDTQQLGLIFNEITLSAELQISFRNYNYFN